MNLPIIPNLQALAIRWAVLALVAVGCVLFGYGYGVEHQTEFLNAKHQAAIQGIEARSADQVAAATTRARDAERKHQDDMTATVATYEARNNESNAEIDRLGSALHTGSIRLLDRFTCGRGLPGATGPTGAASAVADDGRGRGLSADDAEFLVRLAGRAQHAHEQARALRDIAQHDREVTP